MLPIDSSIFVHPQHHPSADYFTISPPDSPPQSPALDLALHFDHDGHHDYVHHHPLVTHTTPPIDLTHGRLIERGVSASTTLPSPGAPLSASLYSLLQMQTAAAYGVLPASRPRPYPVQNVLHVTSDESIGPASQYSMGSGSSSSSSSSSSSKSSSFDLARCSRCQRTPSVDLRTGKSNMVQYGLNLWYCSRCASLVGLTNR